jgi:hypothetical protein
MKLTAKDLRVGNLVLTNNPKYRSQDVGKIAYVLNINSEKEFEGMIGTATIYHLENEWKDTYGQFLEYLQPIPLTEELLLKFGFRKESIPVKQNTVLHETYDLNNLHLLRRIEFNQIWYNNIQVKYVHQLQNLFFSLCEEELTLK